MKINLAAKNVYSIMVAVLLAGYSTFAETTDGDYSQSRSLKLTSPLAENQHFFNYEYRFIGPTAQKVDTAARFLTKTTQWVEEFLSDNNSVREGLFSHLPAWGGLYCNLPEIAGRNDIVNKKKAPYALSLMFCSRFKQAESVCKDILAKEPKNYGALLLLGVLSIYNPENFIYLEQAFLMNPYKTVWILDWHFRQFAIEPLVDWDFADAYFHMLMKHRERLKGLQFPPALVQRLSMGIYFKYEIPAKSSGGSSGLEPGMQELASIIRKNPNAKKIFDKTESGMK